MSNLALTELAARLGLSAHLSGAKALPSSATDLGSIVSLNPATGVELGRVQATSRAAYDQAIAAAQGTFLRWREVPAPQRGELVRRIGNRLREAKDDLGWLVTLEAGKIRSEGLGEVQEMIDMADFAVGLSRQLYGLTIASERPQHQLLEQWHPLGPVGVITAFNFPVAVWAWNALLSLVCGNPVVWKPSQLTPLTAVAVQNLAAAECAAFGFPDLCQLVQGGAEVGHWLAEDGRLPLISATGSTAMGKGVGATVSQRLGRSLLELGGNNGLILAPSANLDLALRGILFAAVGTAGQRCTTLRRLIVHESLASAVVQRLKQAYHTIPTGDPADPGTLLGPLIRPESVVRHHRALQRAASEGGEVLCGKEVLAGPGYFVRPALVRAPAGLPVLQEETFSPILYLQTYTTWDEAIALHNGVSQGLSSAIFTENFAEAQRFLSVAGSDCGIANVNLGTSGAEIGGAFGGEKASGGGREAGSDAWKAYMRRQTCTLNYGQTLPLAQGVRFDVL